MRLHKIGERDERCDGHGCRDDVRSLRILGARKVGHIAAVTGVNVDLASGTVSIDTDRTIDTDAIEDAAEEAGYQLVS